MKLSGLVTKIKCVLPLLLIAAKIPFSDLKTWTFLTQTRWGRPRAVSLPRLELLPAPRNGWWGMPQTTTSCPVLHNDLAPSYGKINQDRSDMIQPFTSIILHKTTDHSSASSTHRRRLTRVSPASRMPLANVCNKSGPLQKEWLKTCSWRMSLHGFSCSLSRWLTVRTGHSSSGPISHQHTTCAAEIREEGNHWTRRLGVGAQSQHGLHFHCQVSFWMEHPDLGLPSHYKVTLPHISSPSLKPLSHSLLLPTLLNWLFCSFRLNLNTKAAIPAPHWSRKIIPIHSFTLQTLTSALPARIIYKHSSSSDSTLDTYHCLSHTQTAKKTSSNHPCSLPKR